MPQFIYDEQGNAVGYDTGAGVVALPIGFDVGPPVVSFGTPPDLVPNAGMGETPEEMLARLNPDLAALRGPYGEAPSLPPRTITPNLPGGGLPVLPSPAGIAGAVAPRHPSVPLAAPSTAPAPTPALVDVRERTETTRRGPEPPPPGYDYPGGVIAAGEAEKASLERQGALEGEQASVLAGGTLDLARKRQADIAAQQEASERAEEEARANVASLTTEYQAMRSKKIDPGQVWDDMGTGQKAASYISAAIAGFLNPTGPNSTIALLQDMIAENVQAQSANLENEMRSLEAQTGLARDARFATKDALEQKTRLSLASWEALRQETEAQAAAINDPILREQYARMGVEIDQNILDTLEKHRLGERDFAYEKNIKERQVRVQEGHLALERKKFNAATLSDPNDPRVIVDPRDGKTVVGVLRGTVTQAQDYKKTLAANFTMADNVGRLWEKASAISKPNYQGPLAKYTRNAQERALFAEYEGILADYIFTVSGKAATKEEVVRLKEALPAPKSWLTASPTASWAAFTTRLARKVTNEGRALQMEYDFGPVFQSMRPATLEEVQLKSEAPPLAADAPEGSRDYVWQVGAPAMRKAIADLTGDAPHMTHEQLWRLALRMTGSQEGAGDPASLLGLAGLDTGDFDALKRRFEFYYKGGRQAPK